MCCGSCFWAASLLILTNLLLEVLRPQSAAKQCAEVFLPAYLHTVVDRGQCAATGAAHGLLQAKP